MTGEFFVKIVVSLIAVMSAIVGAYIIPWLKSKIASELLNAAYFYIEKAVLCADQIFTKEEWATKKAYVTDYALRIVQDKLHIDLTQEDVDIIIEAIVKEVHSYDGC